ncbi:MAG: hypothetical protein V3W41_13065 [Planctomycetota bacterium]
MEPRVNWTMASFRKAQDVIASGEGGEDDRTHLSAMVGDFEKDLAEGWEPASGETKAPAARRAQEVGIGGEYDPSTMRGQLTGPLVGRQQALPDPEIGDGDNLADAEIAKRAPTLYDTDFRSASQQKALFADPIYAPDPGEIDPLTGLAAAGEGFAEPEQPYFHQEPSVEQFIDYLERAKASTDRPEMQAQWDEALSSAQDKGDESPYFAEFADRQWQEVRRAFAAHRAPVTRIAYQDVAKGNLGARLEGEFARISEPFLAGADQMATFGVGAEAMAMNGNKRYSKHQEEALATLEENGTLMPMAARTKDVMETSPWMTGAGMLAGALTPGGAANLVFKVGAKATAAAGKAMAAVTPTLFRGTSMGAQAARGVAKHGVAGGGAALVEESGRGLVAETGRAIREEEDTGIGAPMGPGEAFLAGGLGGTLGGGIAAGIGGMGKSLRLTGDKATRRAIAKVEDLLPGQRGTSVLRGIKETPEMKAVLETELRAGTSAGRKTGVEEGLRGMRGDVAKLGREEQEIAFKAAGEEKVAFHAANETNLKSMQESSDRMLMVARRREGTPFADDESFFRAFRDVTDVKAVASQSEAQALAKAHGGQVMSLGDAKKLFGAKYVKAKIGRLKADDPAISDVVDDAPLELLPPGQAFPTGPLVEPAEAALDASPIHLVVTGKRLNPRQYDDAVDALNRKIRYGEGDAYKDPEWKQLGLAIRKDRDQFGGEWGTTKKRHEDVANLWEKRRKDFGIKADWNERDQVQLDGIHKALRKAGNVDDATDAEIWALLEKKPALVKKLQVLKATEARRELMSGGTTPTRWGIMRELYGGARLRADPLLGGMIGDPLTALGPGRLGMLTPPTEAVENMGSGAKDLLQRLFRMTPTPEGQSDVSPPSN